jgi:hypothetical protein
MGATTYQGFAGGLYPGGVNTPPAGHLAAALQRAAAVQALADDGSPDPGCGKIVMVSIGMSNTAHKFGRFERQEDTNQQRNPRLVIVNGAQGGQSAEKIANPAASYWQLVLERLDALALTPEQVQVVWMEEATSQPPNNFPLHAQGLQADLEAIVQILHDLFPNLQLCYLSDRTFGDYTSGTLNPEPQAFETGFANKWLIEDQINGAPALNYEGYLGPVEAPLLLWGPYLWADGDLPNSLGTQWCACDYENCNNAHPSPSGEQKVADLLSGFFAGDPTSQPWFANPDLPTLIPVDAEADAHVASTQPNTNFGADTTLLSEASPQQQAVAYVRFDTTGVQRPLLHAKLSFRNPESSLSSGDREVFFVDDTSWGEATITYANAPPLGTSLGVMPRASRDGTRSLDVTAVVNADPDRILTFAVTAPPFAAQGSLLVSREGGEAPRLVLMRRPGAPEVYCTAGTSANGCTADIRANGVPSATATAGFFLRAVDVEGNKPGLFYYAANGRQANPWGSGTSYQCVAPPVFRGGLLPGAGANGTCSGQYSFDLNARWCPTCPKPHHNPGAGVVVQSQLWYRDPANTSNQTTSLSDAIEFFVCP